MGTKSYNSRNYKGKTGRWGLFRVIILKRVKTKELRRNSFWKFLTRRRTSKTEHQVTNFQRAASGLLPKVDVNCQRIFLNISSNKICIKKRSSKIISVTNFSSFMPQGKGKGGGLWQKESLRLNFRIISEIRLIISGAINLFCLECEWYVATNKDKGINYREENYRKNITTKRWHLSDSV